MHKKSKYSIVNEDLTEAQKECIKDIWPLI
jgi:hypothetical protein